ncbi:hypothetical protein HY439_01650 [Candidatus Microgenomates bacterium]|nr:hypothetical protein [Candidatus Microgenomates bacterium]
MVVLTEIPRPTAAETTPTPDKPPTLPKGLAQETYEFLIEAQRFRAYEELSLKQRNLIGIYFGTEARLKDLASIARVNDAGTVRYLIVSGLEKMWNRLPSNFQGKYPKEKVIRLKGGLSDSVRVKMSESRRGKKHSAATKKINADIRRDRWNQDDEYRQGITKTLTGRMISTATKEKLIKAAEEKWRDRGYREKVLEAKFGDPTRRIFHYARARRLFPKIRKYVRSTNYMTEQQLDTILSFYEGRVRKKPSQDIIDNFSIVVLRADAGMT